MLFVFIKILFLLLPFLIFLLICSKLLVDLILFGSHCCQVIFVYHPSLLNLPFMHLLLKLKHLFLLLLSFQHPHYILNFSIQVINHLIQLMLFSMLLFCVLINLIINCSYSLIYLTLLFFQSFLFLTDPDRFIMQSLLLFLYSCCLCFLVLFHLKCLLLLNCINFAYASVHQLTQFLMLVSFHDFL